MKTLLGVYLDQSTADELRTRAGKVGLGISSLADLMIRFGLSRADDAKLREHAQRTEVRSRSSTALRVNERRVIGAIKALEIDPVTNPERLTWRFPVVDVATRAGIPMREAYRALESLRARGLVGMLKMSEDVDRWERPKDTYWWLTETKAQRQGPVTGSDGGTRPGV
jgi:hypothetical protein